MTEELRLDQGRGQCRAVHLDHGAALAIAGIVDGPRDQLLAGAGFAQYEYSGVGAGNLPYLLQNVADGLGFADDLLVPVLHIDLVAQVDVFRLQAVLQLPYFREGSLDLLVGPFSFQRVGENLPKQAESLRKFVRPLRLDAVGNEGDGADDDAPHAGGDEHHGFDAPLVPAVLFFLPEPVRQFLDIGNAEDLSEQDHFDPYRYPVHQFVRGLFDAGKRVGMGDVQAASVRGEMPDAASFEA